MKTEVDEGFDQIFNIKIIQTSKSKIDLFYNYNENKTI